MQRFAALILLSVVVVGAFLVYRYAPNLLSFTDKALAPISISPIKSSPSSAPILPSPYQNSGKEVITSAPAASPLEVAISYVYPKGAYKQYSQVSLRVSGGAPGEKANITGWRIKTSKDYWVIPKGFELYDSGVGDIFVKSGDTVNIYSHSNRLNANYRLNKCSGYIKDITPESYSSCPYPKKDELTGFSGLCQNYINSLGSCQVPDSNPPIPTSDNACREFLSKLNYSGCVARYRNDGDFYRNEWQIWLTVFGNQQAEDIFDPYHGSVQLLDRSGKIVDEYDY